MLRNSGLLDDEGPALDLYLQQCSIRVTARILARMAATLAFGGRNPRTGKQVIAPDLVMRVLATMYTCGMNDRSGVFAFEVGLCAKSGIAGGVIAVAPGRLGIGVYAPPVDDTGNSVPGVRALKHLAGALGLGIFDRPA
jgi:glutaminase